MTTFNWIESSFICISLLSIFLLIALLESVNISSLMLLWWVSINICYDGYRRPSPQFMSSNDGEGLCWDNLSRVMYDIWGHTFDLNPGADCLAKWVERRLKSKGFYDSLDLSKCLASTGWSISKRSYMHSRYEEGF